MTLSRRAALVTLVVLAILAPACVPPYRPPTAAEPHAVVKFRRTYERGGGTSLRETVDVDDHRAYGATVNSALSRDARADAILVHPVPASFAFGSTFFHTESRMVQEQYTVQTPQYTTESYDCSSGYGTSRSYRTCTRPVTRYVSETKYRTVMKQVEVVDSACRQQTRFAPAAGQAYLLQFTYQDTSACSLSCFQQTPLGNGQFRNDACPYAPPPE